MKPKKEPARPARICTLCAKEARPGFLVARQMIRDLTVRPQVEWICNTVGNLSPERSRKPACGFMPTAPGSPSLVYARQVVPMMKVITVRQPWAWLILQGFKDVENRELHSLHTGRIFIHVSKSMTDFEKLSEMVRVKHGITCPNEEQIEATLGRICGAAYFMPQQKASESKWFFGPFGWPIYWAHEFEPTEIIKGQLGTWKAPEDLTIRLKSIV